MTKEAKLKSISRGFAGDSAVYSSPAGEITVSVSWALLTSHETIVLIGGNVIARYHDERYIQPPEALNRLGYDVSGEVDFAASFHSMVPSKSRMVKVTERKLTRITADVIRTVMKKNTDYGDAWQHQGGVGWAVRLADKLMRVENLASGKQALVLGEGIKDTLFDAIGYSLLGLLWLLENDGDEA